MSTSPSPERSYTVLRAVVTDVRSDGVTAQVELVVNDPTRLVAHIPCEAMDELNLRPGMAATALVDSSSITVHH